MQTGAMKHGLRMLQERLAQCSAKAQRHKQLLRCVVGGECSLPLSLGAATVIPEPPTPPFLMQGKKQQELQQTMEELSTKVSVPSSAHVLQLPCLWLCQRLHVCVWLLFPERR